MQAKNVRVEYFKSEKAFESFMQNIAQAIPLSL